MHFFTKRDVTSSGKKVHCETNVQSGSPFSRRSCPHMWRVATAREKDTAKRPQCFQNLAPGSSLNTGAKYRSPRCKCQNFFFGASNSSGRKRCVCHLQHKRQIVIFCVHRIKANIIQVCAEEVTQSVNHFCSEIAAALDSDGRAALRNQSYHPALSCCL